MESKTCSVCKAEKPVSEFYKDARRKDGLFSCCKFCHCARTKRYADANPEKRKAMVVAWNNAHPEKRREISDAWKKRNPEKLRAYAKTRLEENAAASARWRQGNPEKVKLQKQRYEAKHREVINAKARAAHAANPEQGRARRARWAVKNVPVARAAVARRRAAKHQATPLWANEFFIREAYSLAQLRSRMFGFKWHVDHIVPLKSKLVCGLHTHANLQVIPGAANHKKSNVAWPDMP